MNPYQNIYGNPAIHPTVAIGAYVEIGPGVVVGPRTRIGAFTFIPHGVTIMENCFIGPRVTFTNDPHPPSCEDDWLPTLVEPEVVIGVGAVILPGIVLGRGCRIGAGAVVTRSVPPGQTVAGNPARPLEKPFRVET